MSDNTCTDILEKSRDLFSERGYQGTSVQQIADAVGIKKASVYYHFESKQQIFLALVDDLLREVTVYFKEAIKLPRDEAFATAVSESIEYGVARGSILREMRPAMFDPDQPAVKEAMNQKCEMQEAVAAFLEYCGVEKSEIASVIFLDALHGHLQRRIHGDQTASTEAFSTYLQTLFKI